MANETGIAKFRIVGNSNKYLFWGADSLSNLVWTNIKLDDQSEEAVNNLCDGLEKGYLESDWTCEQIRDYLTIKSVGSDVTFDPTGTGLTATTVQDALLELAFGPTDGHSHINKLALDQILDAGSGHIITVIERLKLSGIEEGATRDQIASEVPFTPTLDISSTNVQDAIEEVFSELTTTILNFPHTHTVADIIDLATYINNLPQLHTHANKTVLDQIVNAGSGSIISSTERNKLASIEWNATADQIAFEVPYNNSDSNGLSATNVKDALDELSFSPAFHSHSNLPILEQITDAGSGEVITDTERTKLNSIEFAATADQLAGEVPMTGFATITGPTVQDALQQLYNEINAAIAAHGHDAIQILYDNALSGLTSDNVQDAIDELLTEINNTGHTHSNKLVLDDINDAGSGEIITDAERLKLDGIEDFATADQIASEVPLTPVGDLTSTDVQAGLEELQSEITSIISQIPTFLTSVSEEGGLVSTAVTDLNFTGHGVNVFYDGDNTVTIEIGETDTNHAAGISYDNSLSGITATNVQDALDQLDSEIDDIKADPPGATSVSEDGSVLVTQVSDINFTGPGVNVVDDGDGTATIQISGGGSGGSSFTVSDDDVEVIFAPEDINVTGRLSASNDGDGTVTLSVDAQTALETSVTPNGNLTSTDVQSALEELQTDIDNFVDSDNQEASEVPYDNTNSGLIADDVQEAIDELDTSIDNINTEINNNKRNLFFDNQAGSPPPTPAEVTDTSYPHLLVQEISSGRNKFWIWRP